MASERVVKTIAELIDSGHASLQTGPFGTALKAAEYSTEGVPLISVREIRNGYFELTEHTPFVNQTTLDRLPKFILRKGDIVFGRKGAVDRSAMIQVSQDGWFLGSDGIRLRLDDYCDQRFISYQVRSPLVQNWLMQHAEGTTMLSMNQKVLGRIPLTLPSLPEQKAIAHILGSLDDKIELNRRMNATLEGLAQALFQSWFVDFDPVLDNALAAGNPIPDELTDRAAVRRQALDNGTANREAAQHFPATFQFTAELGWIPEGWARCVLTTIYDVRSGLSKPRSEFGSGHPFLSYKDVMNNPVVPPSLSSLVNTNDRERDAYSVKRGDVFLTRTSETQEELGMSSIALCDYPDATFNGFSKRLRPIEKSTPSPEYAAYFFRSAGFRSAITAMSSLSTRASLNNGMLDRLEILIPNQPAIELFTSFVASLTQRSQANIIESGTLTKLRDTLLPKLISGEVRIPDAAKLAEAAQA